MFFFSSFFSAALHLLDTGAASPLLAHMLVISQLSYNSLVHIRTEQSGWDGKSIDTALMELLTLKYKYDDG